MRAFILVLLLTGLAAAADVYQVQTVFAGTCDASPVVFYRSERVGTAVPSCRGVPCSCGPTSCFRVDCVSTLPTIPASFIVGTSWSNTSSCVGTPDVTQASLADYCVVLSGSSSLTTCSGGQVTVTNWPNEACSGVSSGQFQSSTSFCVAQGLNGRSIWECATALPPSIPTQPQLYQVVRQFAGQCLSSPLVRYVAQAINPGMHVTATGCICTPGFGCYFTESGVLEGALQTSFPSSFNLRLNYAGGTSCTGPLVSINAAMNGQCARFATGAAVFGFRSVCDTVTITETYYSDASCTAVTTFSTYPITATCNVSASALNSCATTFDTPAPGPPSVKETQYLQQGDCTTTGVLVGSTSTYVAFSGRSCVPAPCTCTVQGCSQTRCIDGPLVIPSAADWNVERTFTLDGCTGSVGAVKASQNDLCISFDPVAVNPHSFLTSCQGSPLAVRDETFATTDCAGAALTDVSYTADACSGASVYATCAAAISTTASSTTTSATSTSTTTLGSTTSSTSSTTSTAVSSTTTSGVTTTAPQPGVFVTKSGPDIIIIPTTTMPATTYTYTITITNNGPVPLPMVVATDVVPVSQVVLVNFAAAMYTDGNSSYIPCTQFGLMQTDCTFPLAVGQSVLMYVGVVPLATLQAGEVINNTVTIAPLGLSASSVATAVFGTTVSTAVSSTTTALSSTSTSGSTSASTTSVPAGSTTTTAAPTTTPTPAVAFALTKTGPAQIVIPNGRDPLYDTYTITVTNTGTSNAPDVVLRDDVVVAQTVLFSNAGASYAPANGTAIACAQFGLGRTECHFALAPGQTAIMTVVVQPLATLSNAESITNTATLFSGNFTQTTTFTSVASCVTPCQKADLTLNGVVDAFDLGYLLSFWGPCTLANPQRCYGCAADLNGDNAINALDLNILLAQWGATCPP